MLQIDSDLLAINDLIDELTEKICESEEAKSYLLARDDFLADQDLQRSLQKLADNQDYLAYRPELRELQKSITVNPKVYALKLAENDLQKILSEFTKRLSVAVSSDINVDENLPLRGVRHHGHRKNDQG